MDHQQIFPTNLFIQDDFLARQRIPAMKEKILSLYERKKSNWQTGPDLDKTEPFDWFATVSYTQLKLPTPPYE